MMVKRARRLAYLLLSLILLATAMLGLPRPAAADTPVPLSSLSPGALVQFALSVTMTAVDANGPCITLYDL